MITPAAVFRAGGAPLSIEPITLNPPRESEGQVKVKAVGRVEAVVLTCAVEGKFCAGVHGRRNGAGLEAFGRHEPSLEQIADIIHDEFMLIFINFLLECTHDAGI